MSIFSLDTITAKLGVQIYREAQRSEYVEARREKAEVVAERMANRLYAQLMEAIKEEAKFQKARQV
jgi:hypothetical protein